MASQHSSGREDSARFPFASWCVLCGHVVHSKGHAAKHFNYCPKPHHIRCGCCGLEFDWAAYVAHVNVRGVCTRRQLCWTAPHARRPQFNVSCSHAQISVGRACVLDPSAAAATPPAAAAGIAPSHFAMIVAASSSDTPAPSYAYSSQQPVHASTSSTAYAETPASSERQTASIIVPLRSPTPLSDVDEDLAQIIAQDYADAASQLGPSASVPPAASDPASSSLRSPQPSASASASAPVQPLYAALSPAAPLSQDVASPAALSASVASSAAAVVSPAASSLSAASSAFPADPHIQVALAAQVLWLARVILAGSETTAQQVTDEASRELITLGGYWLTPLANPHEMPLHQLLRQLMPIWRTLFQQHRR